MKQTTEGQEETDQKPKEAVTTTVTEVKSTSPITPSSPKTTIISTGEKTESGKEKRKFVRKVAPSAANDRAGKIRKEIKTKGYKSKGKKEENQEGVFSFLLSLFF